MDYTGIGPKGFELSDQQIYDEVCHRLYLSPIVDARQVTVDVQNGVVYLKGKVNDRSMKKEAEKCAETVLGVKDIFNELQLLN
jgi:osmotically-inducible protein OsmY